MDLKDIEADDITPLGGDGNRIGQSICIYRQMWGTCLTLGCCDDMFDSSALEGFVQEPDFSVFVACVIQVNEDINVSIVGMFIKRVVLMHGKGVTGLRGFDLHG